jgi:hypothetical protein
MNSLLKKKEIISRFNNIADKAIKSVLIPLVTKDGIRIGEYIILSINGQFEVRKYNTNSAYHKVYLKSTALILAGLMNKKTKSKDIPNIIYADHVAYTMRNNIVYYKHSYEVACKKDNFLKMELMASRYEDAENKYQNAKKILQSSYSKIF